MVLELRAFRGAHARTRHPQTIFQAYAGARAFLGLLASEGRSLGQATPADLRRLRALLLARERPAYARVVLKGARFYLRYKAAQGVLGEALRVALQREEKDPDSRLPSALARLDLSARLRRALEAYAEATSARFAPRTVAGYLRGLRFLLEFLLGRGVDPLLARSEDLEAYRTALYAMRKADGRPYTLGAQTNRLKAVKSLYRFLYRRGLVLMDPASVIEFPRGEQRLPRVILTVREVRRILAAAQGEGVVGLRDSALLELLYATGLRVSEVMALELGDVDLEERVLHVVQGKGRKDRNVPLTRAAAEALERYLVEARPKLLRRRRRELFLGRLGARLYEPSVREILRRAVARARVSKRVTCHTFRHTVATHLLKGGADIRHIQAFLGHANLRATERYTRVEITDLRKVVERAHPRGR